MTNHVHLVVDPGDAPENINLVMKRVAGRQTRHFNKLAKRTGSLWEGRFKSSIVSTKEYLLACCRYIELNPLRAAMVDDPADYRWSSYVHKVKGEADKLVDLDYQYIALGKDEPERQKVYKKFLQENVSMSELKVIREALQRGQLTGSEYFRNEIYEKYGFRVSNRAQGRPKK
jgi:putative transposase